MSFSGDLKQSVRDELISISEAIQNRRASDAIHKLESCISSEGLNKIVLPIVELNEKRADRLDDSEYDRYVDKLAITVAEAMALEELSQNRLLRDVSEDMEDDLVSSGKKYVEMLEDWDGDQGGRRRSNRREERSNRRERSSNSRSNSRGVDGRATNGRHVNSYSRNTPEREERSEGVRGKIERGQPRRSRNSETEAVERNTSVSSSKGTISLKDGDIVTKANFPGLIGDNRDVPFYFAGLEALEVRDGTVHLTVLDGSFEVNYEKHRTDVYLEKNRAISNTGPTLDKLAKDMQIAAKNRIKAYIDKAESTTEAAETGKEINSVKITQPTVITGEYEFDDNVSILDGETTIKKILAEYLGDDYLEHPVGISVTHTVYEATDSEINTVEWERFKQATQEAYFETDLQKTKTVLLQAQNVLSPAAYTTYFRIVNDVICNILTCLVKYGVKTNNVLDSWDDIMALIEREKENHEELEDDISTMTSAGMPLFNFEGNAVTLTRHYIFLPVTKSELSIASPVRYATLKRTDRESLYDMCRAVCQGSPIAEGRSPLKTIVTSDNCSLMYLHHSNYPASKMYYVFEPI